MIKFTIPLPPVTKKNSQQIIINKATGRPMIIQSKRYREYEKECGWFLCCCLFYMPTKRRVDLTNLLNAIMDILCFYEVILDDNRDIVYSVDGSRVLYSKENPRTEVTITPIKENVEKWAKK